MTYKFIVNALNPLRYAVRKKFWERKRVWNYTCTWFYGLFWYEVCHKMEVSHTTLRKMFAARKGGGGAPPPTPTVCAWNVEYKSSQSMFFYSCSKFQCQNYQWIMKANKLTVSVVDNIAWERLSFFI